MRYKVKHRTTYHYRETVSLGHNLVQSQPRSERNQVCREAHLEVEPVPAVQTQRRDYFGNWVTAFTIQEQHRDLIITARSVVDVDPVQAPTDSPSWEEVAQRVSRDRSEACLEAYQFAFGSPFVSPGQGLRDYAVQSFPPGRPLVEAAVDLTRRVWSDFRYDPEATEVTTPLSEVLAHRRGVCQDFAHLQIGALRSLGLPARYVSGYLLTVPPPGQARLVGSDASHAWVSVFVPDWGWLDLDPTNNLVCSDQHVVQSWGRDYSDVAPVKGVVLGGGRHAVGVSVDVVPIGEASS